MSLARRLSPCSFTVRDPASTPLDEECQEWSERRADLPFVWTWWFLLGSAEERLTARRTGRCALNSDFNALPDLITRFDEFEEQITEISFRSIYSTISIYSGDDKPDVDESVRGNLLTSRLFTVAFFSSHVAIWIMWSQERDRITLVRIRPTSAWRRREREKKANCRRCRSASVIRGPSRTSSTRADADN